MVKIPRLTNYLKAIKLLIEKMSITSVGLTVGELFLQKDWMHFQLLKKKNKVKKVRKLNIRSFLTIR